MVLSFGRKYFSQASKSKVYSRFFSAAAIACLNKAEKCLFGNRTLEHVINITLFVMLLFGMDGVRFHPAPTILHIKFFPPFFVGLFFLSFACFKVS